MPDEWTKTGAVLDEATLAALESVIEGESPVIVEHRFYRGSREPDRFVFNDYRKLVTYVRTQAHPGDALWFWVFERCCTASNSLAYGKLPDPDGRIPVGGAY